MLKNIFIPCNMFLRFMKCHTITNCKYLVTVLVATKRSFFDKDRFFAVCHSHELNLVKKDYFAEHDDIIKNIRDLMRKTSYQVLASMLRRLTSLRVITSNETCWSSTYLMLYRYWDIRTFI